MQVVGTDGGDAFGWLRARDSFLIRRIGLQIHWKLEANNEFIA